MEYCGVELTEEGLQHHGIKGMHWGIRRYQNPDGTLTDKGKKHYGKKILKAVKNKNDHFDVRQKIRSNNKYIKYVSEQDDVKRAYEREEKATGDWVDRYEKVMGKLIDDTVTFDKHNKKTSINMNSPLVKASLSKDPKQRKIDYDFIKREMVPPRDDDWRSVGSKYIRKNINKYPDITKHDKQHKKAETNYNKTVEKYTKDLLSNIGDKKISEINKSYTSSKTESIKDIVNGAIRMDLIEGGTPRQVRYIRGYH